MSLCDRVEPGHSTAHHPTSSAEPVSVSNALRDCDRLLRNVRSSRELNLRQWNELDRLRLIYRDVVATAERESVVGAAFDQALSELEVEMDDRIPCRIDKARRMPAISVIAPASTTDVGCLVVGLDPVVSLSWEVSFNDFESDTRPELVEVGRLRHGVFVVPAGPAAFGDPLAPIERRVASFVAYRSQARV